MLTGLSLPALLEELAAPREVPGAGSALAVALATAAAVVQMAARLSPESWGDATGVAAQAESLRERAAKLVDEDAEAYRRALEARDAADTTGKPEQRDWALGRVTAAAAEPPLALARLAADLAELCAAAGTRVEPHVHADVAAAAALAAATTRGARELVAVNLTALPGDARIEEADRLVAAAEAAARSLY
ncbi:MAG TPA: cyclodeaminase/cyclohydrolase family protein [Gaiellaceae bacterium]|nr:cyclodeaminase/cyclohydrolase family protein [Gaiellaceae bacterium]